MVWGRIERLIDGMAAIRLICKSKRKEQCSGSILVRVR